MIFLIAANGNGVYKDMALLSAQRVWDKGYRCVLYDLGGLGKGVDVRNSFDVSLPLNKWEICRLKPHLILKTLNQIDETLVYLDADAFLMQRIDEIDDIEFDIGVTYRGAKKRYINAGVLFARPTKAGKNFVQKWIDNIPDNPPTQEKKRSGDQLYLNRMVFDYLPSGCKVKNLTHEIHGAKVHFFEAHNKYNSTRGQGEEKREVADSEKIIHIPGRHESFKEQAKKWKL